MSWVSPSTFVAGSILTAAQGNVHWRDNPNELRIGGIAIASQAANDFIYAASASQLARLAAATGVPRFSGSAWAFVSALLAVASQAANDFLYAASATTLGRVAAANAGVPFFDGSSWAITSAVMIRAWANVSKSGPTLNASFNVASLTDNGTGDTTVTFTTALPSANYAAIATPRDNNVRHEANVYAQATGSVRVFTHNDSAGAAEDADFNLVVVGVP